MKMTFIAVAFCALSNTLFAQTDPSDYRDFPLIVTLQFHSFSTPFKRMGSNFRNIGIGVGTEIGLNGKHDWVQQVSAIWYHNKTMGNGLLFTTQAAWRPAAPTGAYGELRIGIGYLYSFRPVSSYRQVNGTWESAGHKGKGMLAIPVGVAAGVNNHASGGYVSPFVGYQFLLASGYNKSVPVVPETFIQAGARIHATAR